MAEELDYAERIVAEIEGWERRLGYVREEYRKSLESWDRSRARLDGGRALLLWLHAEAVWKLSCSQGKLGEAQGNHWAAREALDAAELEVSRLRREVESEANGLETQATYFGLDEPGEMSAPRRVCACSMKAVGDLTGFSRPVCAVHPDGES